MKDLAITVMRALQALDVPMLATVEELIFDIKQCLESVLETL